MLFVLSTMLPFIDTSEGALIYFDLLFERWPCIKEQLKEEMDEEDIQHYVKRLCEVLPQEEVDMVVSKLMECKSD
jgi:hypothetical protein